VKSSTKAKSGKNTSGGASAPEYEVVNGNTFWIARDKKGRPKDVQLANFQAKIVQTVEMDDGAETRHFFDIRMVGQDWIETIRGLPAEQFESLDWVIPSSGGKARIRPGMKPRMRDAIQYLSGEIPQQRQYSHLGWRLIAGEWRYLHAGGGIGADGNSEDIVVNAGTKFDLFELPDPSEATTDTVIAAVKASLKLLRAGRKEVTVPLFCSIWRAVIGPADFSLHLAGPTGSGKTVLGALAQQHWGAGLDAQHCPGSWSSTANANEGLRHQAKDTLFLQDDLVPGIASPRDIDRTFRGQGNVSGRDRMRADSSIRPTKSPRGLLLSTGEDSPLLHSAAARTLILPFNADTLDWPKVTTCQKAAIQGNYALTLAAFVQWMAGQYEDLTAARPKRVAELREEILALDGDVHKRTPGITAELTFAAEQFLTFAEEIGAIDEKRKVKLTESIAEGLNQSAAAQRHLHVTADPVARFGELLTSALSSGRVYATSDDGKSPGKNPQAWGWLDEMPHGSHIGWIVGPNLYLDKTATYAALVALDRETGGNLPSPHQLWTRLRDRNVLVSTDEQREMLTVRRVLGGARREVLHLSADLVVNGGETAKPQPESDAGADDD
jgi:hypothetical protein